jgi:uncharacterized membrane protein (DUF106 family)
MNKKGSANKMMLIMSLVLLASFAIVGAWNSIPIIKDSVNYILNPSVGKLLSWNLTWGMIILVFIISLITTLIQKYATDQKTIRQLKEEQKSVQEEMKKYRDNPQKILDLQKSIFPTSMKIMELSMSSTFYTIVPFILLFRWFMDYFSASGSPKFFGFLSWFWFYLIFVIISSSIIRKYLKVA